jgi:hypothetical protein
MVITSRRHAITALNINTNKLAKENSYIPNILPYSKTKIIAVRSSTTGY